jgi:hypothetical protein
MAASLKFPSCLTTVTVDVLERHLFAGSVDGRVYAVDLTMPLPASNSDAMFMASEGGLLVHPPPRTPSPGVKLR